MIGSGRASITERSMRCCCRHAPGLPAQLAGELAHRAQQPAGQGTFGLGQGRPLLVERQALDPGGDGLELAQP